MFRYGSIPEVARFDVAVTDEKPVILRRATPQDHDRAKQLRSECQRQFDEWRRARPFGALDGGMLPGRWMSRLIPAVAEFQDHQLAGNATN